MKGSGSVIAAILGLWIAAILQTSLAPRMAIGLGEPDFCLILLASLGLFYDRRGNLLLGFGCGFILGALSGVNLTLYVVSRCAVGFLYGWLLTLGVQRNAFVAAIAGGCLTALADLLFLFLGGSHGAVVPYLAGTLVASMYDGVIAAVLFFLIEKLVNPQRQDRF